MNSRLMFAAPIAVAAFIAPSATDAQPRRPIKYAVIVEIHAVDGKFTDVTVDKIIDPNSGSTAAVPDVTVSEAWLKKLRDYLTTKDGGKTSPGYSYYYMYPAMPDEVMGIPRQP